MKRVLPIALFILFSATLLTLSVRGVAGNPTSATIHQATWRDDGPFELSPERGRFALAYSLAENQSFSFSLPVARFATPDLGYKNGRYVSLFAPGLSFLVIPGYLAGKLVGFAQVGTFAVVAIVAIINAVFIRSLAMSVGAGSLPATIAALAFLFATPAYAYAITLYQHHISTLLILASIWLLVNKNTWWSLAMIWGLCALSISIDYPNFFLMLPVGLAGVGKMITPVRRPSVFGIRIQTIRLFSVLGMVFPIIFFLWTNRMSYGNPLQLAGTVGAAIAIDEQGKPAVPRGLGEHERPEEYLNPDEQKKSAIDFFDSRSILEGLYVHFLSPDRGVIRYAPIVLFGIAGVALLIRQSPSVARVMIGVVGINVLMYSMWGDPYGGWAFGSRYLIPSYALMAVFVALTLSRWSRNLLLLLGFGTVLIYSILVNTAGALSTNRNPPKIQILALEQVTKRVEKYTVDRNLEYLRENKSKSFLFQTVAFRFMNAWTYYVIVASTIIITSSGLLIGLYVRNRHDQ